MAPSIAFHYVDGRDADTRFSIWSAADIFCSLSDNIQESFGLTVIEAMAAGLPVIASNWNGYREAITHGINGILVNSYLPRVSMADAAYRYVSGVDTYDLYIGALSQLCFVDLNQTASWIARLANDKALRHKLGATAQRAIETTYDWSKVLPRYFELWRHQRDQVETHRADPDTKRSMAWSIHDPTVTFAEFPSHYLGGDAILGAGPLFERWNDLVKQPGVAVNSSVLISRTAYRAIQQEFEDEQTKLVSNVLEKFSQQDQSGVLRSLHWLIKIGLLRLVRDQSGE
jgi:hypothetical protein